MDIKLFYKTQRELATAVNEVVDAYWEEGIEEEELIKHIKTMYINNTSKMMKSYQFTTVVKQQCGKRRLEIVRRIIDMQYVRHIKEGTGL